MNNNTIRKQKNNKDMKKSIIRKRRRIKREFTEFKGVCSTH